MQPQTGTILPLHRDHADAVMRIADEQFGEGYLQKNDLAEYLDQEPLLSCIALEGNTVAGFSLLQICKAGELSSHLFVDEDWLGKRFRHDQMIGHRRLTAVSHNMKNKGLGSKLVKAGMDRLASKTTGIISVAWKTALGTFIGKILEANGLVPLMEISDYWHRDSLENGYNCRICGMPPCRCTAVIYLRLI